MPTHPFEVSFQELRSHLDEYVGVVVDSLQSDFLILPKGPGFVEYEVFRDAFEALRQSTSGFKGVTAATVRVAVERQPIAFIVLRTMLGFTPPEWAHVATLRTGVDVPQGAVRSIDRGIRMHPGKSIPTKGETGERVRALVETACALLRKGPSAVSRDRIHRLDKVDTRGGLDAVRSLAQLGVPYAMLLYERFLGRPFAGHKDSVSELVGDTLEIKIESCLTSAGITYRKTKRAERIRGFDQTPDFIIPDEFAPKVVIEAKVAEDDGTARDKVTRLQHLDELSRRGRGRESRRFEVIACIGGRGFGIRREDMKKLLLATRGKVFTLKTLDRMVECTGLGRFRTDGSEC
ncbi:MAG: hypothetical protein HYY93_13650 [Planctomycetes bacterium]|nr:hypothetical protein [Planctomycetota bacterium]